MAKVWFLADAFGDLDAAWQWYEAQRPGLGDEFIDAIDEAMESIVAYPLAYPVDYRDARRFLVERFPYCLYYRLERKDVVVVACMHAARDPAKRRRRLRG